MTGETRRKKGPVTRKYSIEFDVSDMRLFPPEPTAPLREHRMWIDALLVLYPEAKVKLLSIPDDTTADKRELRIR